MSSNAFARSRPRVRHQRVPRAHCYGHPRFLQLVKELARLDEVKKKQEEADVDCGSSSCDDGSGFAGTGNSTTAPGVSDCLANQNQLIGDCCSGSTYNAPACCSVVLDEAQTSNGYRSLDCNQSTSALHDSYYRQNNNNNNNHNHIHHNHYQHHSHHPETNHLSNNNLHHQQDERCPTKSTSNNAATSTTNISFGYSKQGLVEQNNSDFSSSSSDLRQDENRSKRKRSSNDLSSKKLPSASSPSCGATSKRHKSSPEPARPLSPSFTKCPICLLDCMDRDPSFTNTCFHLFCYVCIENWTKNKATCPLCRTKFTKIIYNIRSASCFDEKVASPVRRDDDDERVIYEQLQGLNTNTMVPMRNSNVEDTRLLFDNLRNNDVLMPPFAFVNQIDSRQVDPLHSFNSVTTTTMSVPHTPFTNYNPITSNYIALIPSNNRIQSTTSTAITGAYTTSAGLATSNADSSNRLQRISRSGRYIYSRSYDMTTIDGSTRISRSTNTSIAPTGIPLVRQQHHPHPHPGHHPHHTQHNQHRSATLDLGSRPSQRVDHPHLHIPMQPRQYYPNPYSRRPYTNQPIDQQILDNFYRQMPDM